jgi:hypothetical protein
MAFKRFYNQFTESLDRRFRTELQLSPSAISEDVQLIADIERPVEVPMIAVRQAIGMGSPTLSFTQWNLGDIENALIRAGLLKPGEQGTNILNQFDLVELEIHSLYGGIRQEAGSPFTVGNLRDRIDYTGIPTAPMAPATTNVESDNRTLHKYSYANVTPGANTSIGYWLLPTPQRIPLRVRNPNLFWSPIDNIEWRIIANVSITEVFNSFSVTHGTIRFLRNISRSQ